jgi:biopolymer transport protein ExbD
MAGATMDEGQENPVGINITPLVDIIFCLCVFFMISFKFKQLEGKFETWMPKDKGAQGMPLNAVIKELRVAMLWDEGNQRVIRKMGTREVPEDEVLQQLLAESSADFKRLNNADPTLTIDADTRIPWAAVMNVINLGKRVNIDKIEFAYGAPPK